MGKLKLAVIVDDERLSRFFLDALDAVRDCDEIVVLSCGNSRSSRRPLKHGLYYALNLLAVRSALTRHVPIAATNKRIKELRRFNSDYEGAWQRLPDDVLAWLAEVRPDAILKFGMNLLRVPERERLAAPILSYHHGDPDQYRGRPAGFYEILNGERVMGQIVQVLSNRLDAGAVVAFGETKVRRDSYKATLREAYRHSPLLINAAIRNTLADTPLPKPCDGRNYRLPSNGTVAKFIARLGWEKLKRSLYGAFFEKHWHVSTADYAEGLARLAAGPFPAEASWRTIPPAKGHRFHADPFFVTEPRGVLVEGLSRRSGRGEILWWDGAVPRTVLTGLGHASYPCTARVDGRELVIPEIARWSEPRLYAFEDNTLRETGKLQLEGRGRILDPTLIEEAGRLYLFGNLAAVSSTALCLWSADTLADEFRLHPCSPIRISPRGSRMGGGLARNGEGLFRLGQDATGGYGDGLFLFRVDALDASTYSERLVGEIRLADRRGPHTLNVAEGRIVFDWYRDRFSPLAGVRRLRSRFD